LRIFFQKKNQAARFSSERIGNLDVAEQAFKRAMARSSGKSQVFFLDFFFRI
jgi:hypothetical protein